MSSEKDIADSIKSILAGSGKGTGSNSTAEALRQAGITATPYGPMPSTPGTQGHGKGESGPDDGSTAGIASPLTEVVGEDGNAIREYHPNSWLSADGLLSYPAVKVLKMVDANEAEVEFRYAPPPETT